MFLFLKKRNETERQVSEITKNYYLLPAECFLSFIINLLWG